MTDDIEQMQDTFDRDQDDAAIRDITRQVRDHFMQMRYGTQMTEASALILTRDFQRMLMGGVDVQYVGVAE